MGCCQTPLPANISSFNTTSAPVPTIYNATIQSFSPCSYSFVAEVDLFKFDRSYVSSTNFTSKYIDGVPLVLDWVVGNGSCSTNMGSQYACQAMNSECVDVSNGPGYRCNCSQGYEGNPYLQGGCQDINECEPPDQPLYPCKGKCINTEGNYTCLCPSGFRSDDPKNIPCVRADTKRSLNIVLGISFSVVFLMERQLTEKSDVYSFGVVLLELITGKTAIYHDGPKEGKSLASSFLLAMKDGSLDAILDASIVSAGIKILLGEVAELARMCLSARGEERPSMTEVADKLKALRSTWRAKLVLENGKTERLVMCSSPVASALHDPPSTSTVSTGPHMSAISIETPRPIIDRIDVTKLSGRIPEKVGSLQSLKSLDLSFNELSGEIPSGLSDITMLSRLNLSYNNLSGRISPGDQLQSLIDPASSYIGNNHLCGPPLSRNCWEPDVTREQCHHAGHDCLKLKDWRCSFVVGETKTGEAHAAEPSIAGAGTSLGQKLLLLVAATLILQHSTTVYGSGSSWSISMARPGCPDKCGNVSIPYPFGTGKGCFQEPFSVTCNESRAYLASTGVRVLDINLTFGEVRVQNPKIASQCNYTNGTNSTSLAGLSLDPFHKVSNTKNKLISIGCSMLGMIVGVTKGKNQLELPIVNSCFSFCTDASSVDDSTECAGMGCCQTPLPGNISSFNTTSTPVPTVYNATIQSFSPCSYSFIAEVDSFKFDRSYASSTNFRTKYTEGFPLVLDWVVGNGSCSEATRIGSQNACQAVNSECINVSNGPGYRCNCAQGYAGNPYLQGGCRDINECEHPNMPLYPCKAIYHDGPKEAKNLASSFLLAMKDGSLDDILDASIVGDGMETLLGEVAEMASMCLSTRGKERPSMTQVADKLKALRSTWMEKLVLEHGKIDRLVAGSSPADLMLRVPPSSSVFSTGAQISEVGIETPR
ncbi:hypothetical protein ZWY2020_041623 [Hordeum vulgare]|nr:hypothetical protein ZWY2020_041623 [Hordeum vulgare]